MEGMPRRREREAERDGRERAVSIFRSERERGGESYARGAWDCATDQRELEALIVLVGLCRPGLSCHTLVVRGRGTNLFAGPSKGA